LYDVVPQEELFGSNWSTRCRVDCVVGIAPRLRAGSSGRGKEFFSFPRCPDHLWPPTHLFIGYRVSFPGVKPPEREVDYSPPSGADIRNVWSYTSSYLLCLQGVDKEDFFWGLAEHLC
jgi:hypothetical protein